jgi:hypothetical protein
MDTETRYHARTGALVVESLEDELLVYDERTDVAHCLTPVAALVWRTCQDGSSLAELTDVVRDSGSDEDHEQLVLLALADLAEKGLLADAPTQALVSRRDALRRMGQMGAAVAAAPLVVSAAIPSAAAAHSPVTGATPQYHRCNSSSDCIAGTVCTAGTAGQGGSSTGQTFCFPSAQTCYSSGTKPNGQNCDGAVGRNLTCCSGACAGNFCSATGAVA